MKTYNYNGRRVFLQKGEYRNNGSIAVLMFGEGCEFCRTITVNLEHPLQDEEFAFIDEKTFPGIRRWIKKNKLGEFTGYEARSGPNAYPLYKIF